ncbi:hypothetical protein SLS58_001622 [Diplodia intermedia]|uniref:Uncharacterized protein n=1 Tax=Diplodia intermedia TaxID=856260 RepID=A0ABR3U1M6_9PEZI
MAIVCEQDPLSRSVDALVATPHAITPAVPDLPLPTSRSGTPARKNAKESERSKAIEVSTEASKTPTITKSIPGKVQAAVATPTTAKADLAAKIETPKVGDKAKSKPKGSDADNVPVTPSRPAEESQPSPYKTIAQVVASEPKASSVPPSPLKAEHTSSTAKHEMKSAMSSTKRQHPGPLQIPKKESLGSDTDAAAKNPRAMSITAESTSRPGTPTGATTGSPLKRTGPQIMRITNTPKAETPPAWGGAASAPVTAAVPPSVASIRSRQPSIASINQPGTPVSEFVSDNASMTSTSMSRTNSPPPAASRIGSAPQRTKTKSQAKKERQERARQMTEVELGLMKESRTPPGGGEEPAVIEGIQTRKKKEKKAKPTKAAAKTAVSTPAGSRTGTPAPVDRAPVPEPDVESVVVVAEKEREKEKPVEAVVVEAAAPVAVPAPIPPPAPVPATTPAPASAATAAAAEQPSPSSSNINNKPSPPPPPPPAAPAPVITPASIIAKLQASGAVTHEKLENMLFKSFPTSGGGGGGGGPNERGGQTMTLADVPNRDRQYTLADEAIRGVLERREAHRLGGEDGRVSSRVLVTPEGTILRGLARDEEDRYLELEAELQQQQQQQQRGKGGGGGGGSSVSSRWSSTREPLFDLDRIVRNLNVRAVVDKSNTLRQTQAALQKAAQQAAAAAAAVHHNNNANNNASAAAAAAATATAAAASAAAASKLFDEAANYNDEFILPASPTVLVGEDVVLPPPPHPSATAGPSALDNADRSGGNNGNNLSASTSSTASTSIAVGAQQQQQQQQYHYGVVGPAPGVGPGVGPGGGGAGSGGGAGGGAGSSSLLAAPFESHYIHVNGITLSDAAAPVLGIDLVGMGMGGMWKGGLLASASASSFQQGDGAKGAVGVAVPKSGGGGGGGPVLALQEIERELNAEKQRANEFTKKLNAAIKRNRKVVGAAGGGH